MQITVTFRHTKPTPALKAYAEEKISKVEKFLHSPQEAHVILSVEKIRHVAEVSILADGLAITGKEETSDLYSAIDMVMDKIEKQLMKQKGKRQTLKSGHSVRNVKAKRQLNQVTLTDDGLPKIERKKEASSGAIVNTDNFLPKPMRIEDAALELQNRGDGVVVFRNSENMGICVLHKMKNGKIGLTEAPGE